MRNAAKRARKYELLLTAKESRPTRRLRETSHLRASAEACERSNAGAVLLPVSILTSPLANWLLYS